MSHTVSCQPSKPWFRRGKYGPQPARIKERVNLVSALQPSNFYKSMTTHADHRIWQDVYHAKTANGDGVYLKLTVVDDVLIISFKEL